MISAHRQKLLRQIADACRAHDRDPATVALMAASKQQPPEILMAAIADGQMLFGENRVQEAEKKWPPLRRKYPAVELHLIGPLQTNKARLALELFDVIQSIDREPLLAAIAKHADLAARRRFFVQVNIGREPQKSGVMPELADDLIAAAKNKYRLHVCGLMAIPPAAVDPVPYFRDLAAIAARHGLPQLSMGMTADMETAIACGSTMVRVGTGLFGVRR